MRDDDVFCEPASVVRTLGLLVPSTHSLQCVRRDLSRLGELSAPRQTQEPVRGPSVRKMRDRSIRDEKPPGTLRTRIRSVSLHLRRITAERF